MRRSTDCGRHGGRRLSALIAVAVTALAMAAAAPVRAADKDASWEAARQFDRFLDDHPWVARDLQRDPALANDPRYIEDHRSLGDFLEDHPDVRRQLRRDPWAVLRRQHRVERAERRDHEITRDELRSLDRFLHDHPAVARDLRGDPSLVNSRHYLADHPSFRDFLHDHPAIREEMQSNPYTFLRRSERHRDESDRDEQPRRKH